MSDGGASGTSAAGAGGAGGTGGKLGPREPAAGGSSATGECTPDLGPNDEFFIPCEDAGEVRVTGDAAVPIIDAAIDRPEPDAAIDLPEPDASVPPESVDEGACAQRLESCDIGRAEISIGSAVCEISGFSLTAEPTVCEVCDKPTHLIDFSLAIMDCGVCSQVYREGTSIFERPISASTCESQALSASLEWTAADPGCVDVYAYIGSGEADGNGAVVLAADQVRICRCDRTTDTCISCAGGACD
jgi:hypothetical protein